MPALAFGLKTTTPQAGGPKAGQKRKGLFDDDEDASPSAPPPTYGAKKISKPLRPLKDLDDDDDDARGVNGSAPTQFGLQTVKGKATNARNATKPNEQYTNLSALRSAKLHDEEASKIDSSVYDYDAAYETFHVAKEKKSNGSGESGPKYMGSLMQSAEVRKRDQLRAKDKLLQREREAEGDDFADKEKFVTGAYKKQQEEIRRMEEEEKKREEAEDERRRKGGGMTDFHKRMLEKDEERTRDIKLAEEEAAKRKTTGVDETMEDEDKSEAKIAEELNSKGAKILVNDDGEVVDKRQLLGAGLNVAPKKPGKEQDASRKKASDKPQEYWRSSNAQDARQAQRERQSRMMERQLEEMMEKQKEAEVEEERLQHEKTKSKVTEADKMSARERFLQRKKEREEEAKKKKEAGG
jgi:coiled-coil domain-containing protein 55